MEQARVTLRACMLRACKGPGVDLSGTAQVSLEGDVQGRHAGRPHTALQHACQVVPQPARHCCLSCC